ncbi:hypothetical protein [Cytobacillus oceanisediminis]|uniref:Uncharacterized protein n=1 Tax=Cytobacillus oceanisediminis 2691 TaxID=1196031 RepID=A0A160MI01_9BACI|nr:hypothetical protein [Cytobacillus oceanisediminis]AND42378.1 hypothetical protein A361_25570 [Cytobacillus oceanisediminis 2691]MCM3245056.1 hypothetical protein [Cytobacillus oceanisediminis]MCS0827234.1 hypothetical protein [Cytobacillus firmus]
MKKKMKSLILTGALAACLAATPNFASADSPYNTQLGPLQSKYIAEEVIWADASIRGNQQPVYSGGRCGVEYRVVNSGGATVDFGQRYGVGEFTLSLDLNSTGAKLRLKAKNLYADLVNTVKIWGTWLD